MYRKWHICCFIIKPKQKGESFINEKNTQNKGLEVREMPGIYEEDYYAFRRKRD